MKLPALILILFWATLSTIAQTAPDLRAELLRMLDIDQKARAECVKGTADEQKKCFVETLEKIDQPHAARLNEIFVQTGFPTEKSVGKDGLQAFMILLQHTPDETLRRKSIKPITKAFKRREIPPHDYANFVDRLLVHQGKPQLYGSNFDMKDGKLVMSPVRNRQNLARRRKKIGLPPIEEYARMMKEIYHLEVVISPD
jgi:hypothetical protein